MVALLVFCLTGFAAEKPRPVGHLLEIHQKGNLESSEEAMAGVTVKRAGKDLEVRNGLVICEGDVIATKAEIRATVAFKDLCALTLCGSSRATIGDYRYPSLKKPTWVRLDAGGAHFDVKPRPAEARFHVRASGGGVQVKGTSFFVYTRFDPSANGGDGANLVDIVVKKGEVTSTDLGGNSYDIIGNDLTSDPKIYTLNMLAGDSEPVVQGIKEIDKSLLKAWKTTAVSVTKTDKSTSGALKVMTKSKFPDGTQQKSLHREMPGGVFMTKFLSKRGKDKEMKKLSGSGSSLTSIHSIKNASVKEMTKEVKTGSTGTYSWKFKAMGSKEKYSQKGTISTDAQGREVITVEEKGVTATGVKVTNKVTITREYVNGLLVETHVREPAEAGGDIGGMPTVVQITHNANGSTTKREWFTENPNIATDPPGNVTSTAGEGVPINIQTPGNTQIDLNEPPKASP